MNEKITVVAVALLALWSGFLTYEVVETRQC